MSEHNEISPGWKAWLRPGRIVPLLTLLVAGSAGVLSLFNLYGATFVDGVIITLLALLAIDALTERLTLLEKIERQLSTLPIGQQLKSRSQLLSSSELASTAREISMVVVSGIALFHSDLGFFQQKMREGCKFRIVLLDPTSSALQTWDKLVKVTVTGSDIRAVQEMIKQLMEMEGVKGECEVRLSKVFLPYRLFMTDPDKNSGSMVVEFYTFKTAISDRPNLQISKLRDQHWFEFYRTQFEQFWLEAERWNP